MSAKRVVLDAVGAMPDGATWHEILQQVQTLVAGCRDDADGKSGSVPSAGELNAPFTRRLHPSSEPERLALEADLDALAADPDIQRELRRIEEEFACTDWDGMEGF